MGRKPPWSSKCSQGCVSQKSASLYMAWATKLSLSIVNVLKAIKILVFLAIEDYESLLSTTKMADIPPAAQPSAGASAGDSTTKNSLPSDPRHRSESRNRGRGGRGGGRGRGQERGRGRGRGFGSKNDQGGRNKRGEMGRKERKYVNGSSLCVA